MDNFPQKAEIRRPGYPVSTARMRAAYEFEKIKSGLGLEVFLARATISSMTDIRLRTYPNISMLRSIQTTFLKRLYAFYARALRFDRNSDGEPLRDHELYMQIRFLTFAGFKSALALHGHQLTRSDSGMIYPTLHLKIPGLLNLSIDSDGTSDGPGGSGKGGGDGNLANLLEKMDQVNSAEQAKVLWNYEVMREADLKNQAQAALLGQLGIPSSLSGMFYPTPPQSGK